MNYEAKQLKAIELLAKSKDRGDWHEAKVIQYYLEIVTNTAKVDIRHANGILDRLLKSDYCTYLLEDKKNTHKTTVKEPHDYFSVELEELE